MSRTTYTNDENKSNQNDDNVVDDDPIFMDSSQVQHVVDSLAPNRRVTSATIVGADDLDHDNAQHLVAFFQQKAETLRQLDLTCSLDAASSALLSTFLASDDQHQIQSIRCCGTKRPDIDEILLSCLANGLGENSNNVTDTSSSSSVRSLYLSGFSFQRRNSRLLLERLLMSTKLKLLTLNLNFCEFDSEDNDVVCLTHGLATQCQLQELSLTCCKLTDAASAEVLRTCRNHHFSTLTKLGLFENHLETASVVELEAWLSSGCTNTNDSLGNYDGNDCSSSTTTTVVPQRQPRLQELHVHQSFFSSCSKRKQRFLHLLRYANTSLERVIVGLGGSGLAKVEQQELQQYSRRNQVLAQTRVLLRRHNGNNETVMVEDSSTETANDKEHRSSNNDEKETTVNVVSQAVIYLAGLDSGVGASALYTLLRSEDHLLYK